MLDQNKLNHYRNLMTKGNLKVVHQQDRAINLYFLYRPAEFSGDRLTSHSYGKHISAEYAQALLAEQANEK